MKNNLIILLPLLIFTYAFPTIAQPYAGDFSWVSNNVPVSSTTVKACNDDITIRLVSSTNHKLNLGKAMFPDLASETSTKIRISLNFSAPVHNLRLKISDLDQGLSSSPDETISNITPAINSISPSISPSGPTFVGNAPPITMLTPDGNNNALGWVQWDGPVSTVTLEFNRPGGGYRLLFDSLSFECKKLCPCDDASNFLSANTTIPNSGATSASLLLNSNGEPISKLVISIPNYTSLADEGCMKCDPANISNYGKITSLPFIAGVTPSFTGPSLNGAREIVYDFPTPIVINHLINFSLQLPPTLDLVCCENKVSYCVKVGMINPKCEICELVLCTKPEDNSATSSSSTPAKRFQGTAIKADQIGETSSLKEIKSLRFSPNPAHDALQVILPSDAPATLEILSLKGEQISTQNTNTETVQLNIARLVPGVYIIKYRSKDQTISNKFVKN